MSRKPDDIVHDLSVSLSSLLKYNKKIIKESILLVKRKTILDFLTEYLRACLESLQNETNKSKREHLKRILKKPFSVLPEPTTFV